MEPARAISYRDIAEGATREREYVITPVVYESFLRAFDDRSPIHVDPDEARARGYSGCVMHGSILSGFVSHFVGMVFPGASSLLLSVDLRFSNPSYLGDALLLTAKVAQKVDAHQVVVMHLNIWNQTRGLTGATGRVQVQVREP